VLEFPSGFAWLAHLLRGSAEAAAALSKAARRSEIRPGDRLTRQGERNAEVHFVAEGRAGVHLETGAERLSLGTKGAGDFVGELGFIDPGPATATVEVEAPTVTYALSHDDYVGLRAAAPRAAGALLSGLCCDVARRIRRSTQMSIAAAARDGRSVVAEAASMEGADRAAIAPVHVPRSAHGHTAASADGKVLEAVRAAGAFRPPPGADAAYVAGLDRDLERIAYQMGVQEHRKGDVIVRAGEQADGVFVILEGRVRVEAGRKDAWFHVDRELGPGALFGHLAFFEDGRRAATCTAATPLRLAVLYPAAVQMLLAMGEKGQSIGVHLIDWFARQLVADARALHERVRERLTAEVSARRG
jgi:CRP-like cAMP-binding protein